MKKEKIVRIVISGHRHLDLLNVIEDSVENVIKSIIARHQKTKIYLYSSLAPGADQIVAKCATRIADIQLVVVLPMQINEYLKVFTDKQKDDFWEIYNQRLDQVILPAQPNHEKSFLNLGLYLVKNCDYLITVWNGQKERGMGGTAQVVEMAKKAGLKIAWIRANNIVGSTTYPISNNLKIGSVELINW